MTSLTDNIRVALYGQYGNDTRYEFTWPEPFNPFDTSGRFQWLRSFTDPRLLRSFPGAGRCYLLWSTADGFYYGLCTLQPDDPRGGCALTALFTGRHDKFPGRIQPVSEPREQPLPERLRNRHGIPHVPAQAHRRADLVHILTAGAAGLGKLPLQFRIRDENFPREQHFSARTPGRVQAIWSTALPRPPLPAAPRPPARHATPNRETGRST